MPYTNAELAAQLRACVKDYELVLMPGPDGTFGMTPREGEIIPKLLAAAERLEALPA